jgi:hypothetical protein
VQAFGKEYTGKHLDELFDGERLRLAEEVFRRVCASRRALFVRSQYHTTKDVKMLANRLYMPLSEDGQAVNMILGALTFEYGSGAFPGLFGTASLTAGRTLVEIASPEPAAA